MKGNDMFEIVNEILSKIRKTNPLILNITNHVTIDFVANGLLSIGASPVMSFAEAEMDDLVQLSSAVVINLGTLDDQFNHLCHNACKIANEKEKKIIFDPVGAGASLYRTETCNSIIKNNHISVIRANAGEIMALAGYHSQTKGVDSRTASTDSIKFAEELAYQYDLTVCMSGKIDVILDKYNINEFDRGSSIMPKVTGTGCLLTSIVAAFNAVHDDFFEATSAACLFYAICGEIAEEKSSGPASFKINFLDALNQNLEIKFYETK
jgi:hydroxyethylthiazole kinase